jgi:hypothetical protein
VIGSVIFGMIWNKMYADVKLFLIALKMQACVIISEKYSKKGNN